MVEGFVRPAREPAFVPRPINRGDYPSSQLGSASQPQRPPQRQGRYDERQGRGGGRPDGRQDGRGERPDMRQQRTGMDRGPERAPERGMDRGMNRDMDNAIPSKGVLEIIEDANYGFIRQRAFHLGEEDIYVSMSQIKKFGLRSGDMVEGFVRPAREQERYQSLVKVDKVNGEPFAEDSRRINFEKLTPIYPNQRVLLETDQKEISTRLIDLFSPIGRGTRGIIVAKPKAGKTVMLKKIANAVATNHPDIELIALLIDERPEEVTDFERNVQGLVISSTFDEKPENHIQVAELVIEYAKRRVEMGQDVFLLLDSLTRLARAYNLTCPPSGKTLSGGLDPNSLYKPKRFLGAARKIENGGSLTILCSALVETGSRLDDIIFEEFKGTANMELHLSRELADKRIFPSVDIIKSGTRHEELLYNNEEMDVVWRLRRMVADMDEAERMNRLITRMVQTKSNIELLMLIQKATE
jgi:transcription termination factor Rho